MSTVPREELEAVYAEAKRIVDSLDEIAVMRCEAWAGVDIEPLSKLLGGPTRPDFSAALRVIEETLG